jgi:hypothetical protein
MVDTETSMKVGTGIAILFALIALVLASMALYKANKKCEVAPVAPATTPAAVVKKEGFYYGPCDPPKKVDPITKICY